MARLLFVDDMTEQALDRIGGFYSSGALAWAKAIRPDLWEQVLDAARVVVSLRQGGDLQALASALELWKAAAAQVVEAFPGAAACGGARPASPGPSPLPTQKGNPPISKGSSCGFTGSSLPGTNAGPSGANGALRVAEARGVCLGDF